MYQSDGTFKHAMNKVGLIQVGLLVMSMFVLLAEPKYCDYVKVYKFINYCDGSIWAPWFIHAPYQKFLHRLFTNDLTRLVTESNGNVCPASNPSSF